MNKDRAVAGNVLLVPPHSTRMFQHAKVTRWRQTRPGLVIVITVCGETGRVERRKCMCINPALAQRQNSCLCLEGSGNLSSLALL